MIPLRDIPRFDYMAFAKSIQKFGPYNLACSGAPSYGPGTLPLDMATLPLNFKAPYGLPDLKLAIAARYDVTTEEVFLAPGTSGVNFLLYGALLSPGDEIVVERPAYQVLHQLPLMYGAKVTRWDRPADAGFPATADSLAPLITDRTRAVVMTDPHNPSGVHIDFDGMMALAGLAEERGIALIVDEVYLDMIPGSISARKAGSAVIATASLTKTYGMGGLRLGWALAPPDIVDGLNRFHDLADVVCSVPSQFLTLEAFQRLEELVEPARKMFEENFPILDRWVRDRPGMSWTAPSGTIFGFPRLPGGVSSQALYDLVSNESGTYFVPGAFFDGLDDHLRIGFGVDGDILEKGLEHIGEGIDRLSGLTASEQTEETP